MKSRPRPLCYLWATRKSENWPGRSVVTQTQKVLFLYNCCSTTLVSSLNDRKCCSGRTGRAMEAEWRQSHCHGLLWSPNGGTVIAQWTQLVGLRRYSGDRREAEASLKLIHNVYNSTHFLWSDQWPNPVHPFCDHGDTCAFLLPPLSDLWATDLLGDLCATVLNMLKNFTAIMASMARSEHPLCHPWTT